MDLVLEAGGEVVLFLSLIELLDLNGRKTLQGINCESILKY